MKRSYEPDPRPEKRIKDKGVGKLLHLRGVVCVLCGAAGTLHHVYPRGQGGDDVRANMVGLCGDGVSGCHGKIENGDVPTLKALGAYLFVERQDTLDYLERKLNGRGLAWLTRKCHLD